MREIKFRAWDTVNSCWIRFFHIPSSGKDLNNYPYITLDDEEGKPYFDFKLIQYTGLKDKNGKEIYEGDIVTADYKVITSRYKVVIEDGHTQLVRHPIRHFLDRANRDIYEVIGNIYENKELLKA